jgi:hypothetical protein
MKLSVDETKADPLFLYYVFISPEQQEYIRQNAIQTGVPHTNLGILRNTPVSIPPIAEQRAIAHILRRRQQITDLYLQGWTQLEIAQQLSVSQALVSADLRAVCDQWRQSALRDFDLIREIELKKLERIERESWAAWERSQKPAQSADIREGDAGGAARKRIRNQYGDPRFLGQVNQCIVSRRAMLGLDLDHVTTEETDEHVPWEVRRQRVVALVAALRERERIGGAGTEPGAGEPGELRALGEPG